MTKLFCQEKDAARQKVIEVSLHHSVKRPPQQLGGPFQVILACCNVPVPFRSSHKITAGSAWSLLAALAGSSVPSSSHRKAEAPVLLRQSDKKSPEKSGFDFLGDFVLTEELGAAAGQGVKCLPLQSTGV
ncbi:hypothetical protein GS18_0212540 [Metabacillus indicus]|uniref:Uncharacterized protein n=1 Tax=Metabacillus indicus TaxID=246786 RepID=A0A084GX62_METID|nr:hypothetical protein GS18_0212540 [Metabacillus indicus]